MLGNVKLFCWLADFLKAIQGIMGKLYRLFQLGYIVDKMFISMSLEKILSYMYISFDEIITQ